MLIFRLNIFVIYIQTRLKELDVILKVRENSIVFNELDFQISKKEIVDAIASTKTGKACGLDSISNEMLKHIQTSLLPCLCKLFNVCFGNGVYPKIWVDGYISPIFKNVDLAPQIIEVLQLQVQLVTCLIIF
jgi:hypothetical protein